MLFIHSLVLTFFMLSYHQYASTETNSPSSKKNITIFICNGGYGHRAACEAIKPMLDQEYNLTVINPFTDILEQLDYAKKITGKDCDQVYNKLLRGGWTRFINFYCRYIVPHNITSDTRKMTHLFNNYFEKNKTDLVLSLIPIVNVAASNAAVQHNIPYIMVTLDHNTANWQVGMNKCKHKELIATVHNDNVKNAFCKKIHSIPPSQIKSIGFPVRQEFCQNKNCQKIKQEWSIPLNKKVVMLMIGSVGGKKIIEYVKELSKSDNKMHILVCMGSNKKIENSLQKIITQSKSATFSLISFTNKVADLMAVSDLIITKPGPGTIEEALQMKIPLLLDLTSPVLFWEKENVTFALSHEFAHSIKKVKQVNKLIDYYFDENSYEKLKKNINSYHSDFPAKLTSLVRELCPNNT